MGSIAEASQALGELNGIGRTVPTNPYLLIRPPKRRDPHHAFRPVHPGGGRWNGCAGRDPDAGSYCI